MRKTIAVLLLSAALAGCQTTSTTTPGATTTVQQVQAVATQVCGYLPTAQTVLALLNAVGVSVPFSTDANGIAQQICSVVTKAAVSRRGTVRAQLHGVTIRGRFVRR